MKNNIVELIKNHLDIYHIHIEDLTRKHLNHQNYDGGGHYKLVIVSDEFRELQLLKRHKIIYDILKKMIKKEIHALSLQTLTVEEYKNKREAR